MLITALAIALVGMFTTASAQSRLPETGWQKAHPKWVANHPGRTEINDRLANQNRRIDAERKDGQISRARAQQLHHDDHFMRREERVMTSQHDSHLTRSEHRALNQQENGVSRRIGR